MKAKVALENEKFGLWTVKKVLHYGDRLCECACASKTLRVLKANNLIKERTKSCGCNMSRILLQGEKAGEWEIVEVLTNGVRKVKCSCGKMAKRTVSELQESKSCGHPTTALVGEHFGEWVVLKILPKGYRECECSCKYKSVLPISRLTNGTSESCGHSTKALKDDIFGEWKVIEELPNGLRKCKCSCGTIKYIHTGALTTFQTRSCGCARTSSYEVELQELFSEGIPQQKILNGREIDLYFPDKRIGVEFNGNYWHSDVFKDKNYHLNKTLIAEELNIRLIHIFEYEFIHKKGIIVQFLKSQLQSLKVIYARNCKVKEIDLELCRLLEECNNIQGYTPSCIRLALYNGNDIEILMTFKRSYSNKKQYEMVRLTYGDTKVIGGTQKLFKYFLREYSPESIVAYCDRAKFTGKIYSRLGFQYIGHTGVNYKWVKGNEVVDRLTVQKNKLIANQLEEKEEEVMNQLGYSKLYDCGNDKYIWGCQDS